MHVPLVPGRWMMMRTSSTAIDFSFQWGLVVTTSRQILICSYITWLVWTTTKEHTTGQLVESWLGVMHVATLGVTSNHLINYQVPLLLLRDNPEHNMIRLGLNPTPFRVSWMDSIGTYNESLTTIVSKGSGTQLQPFTMNNPVLYSNFT